MLTRFVRRTDPARQSWDSHETNANDRGLARREWFLLGLAALLTFLFGAMLGNLFEGAPFGFDGHAHGDPLRFFNPFALLCGLTALSVAAFQAASWLNYAAKGTVRRRAGVTMFYGAIAYAVLFTLAGMWLGQLDGFFIAGQTPDGLLKTVLRTRHGWYANIEVHPAPILTLIAAYGGAVFAVLLRRFPGYALLCSALALFGAVATAAAALFPFLVPSASNPNASLTVWDSPFAILVAAAFACVALLLPAAMIYNALARLK
ncbi:MAG: cytochrome d ubiquinol oxidase subunit II [Rhizomicrobium sp.]